MKRPRTRGDYYDRRLSGTRLKRCYDIAPPRVQQYLDAEIAYTVELLGEDATVVELGCGYGRVLSHLARTSRCAIGIDIAMDSLQFAKEYLSGISNYRLLYANALHLGLRSQICDAVVCVQNGVSSFGVDLEPLIRESLRVVRPGGIVVMSTYSEKFWQHRLDWFVRQSEEKLIGNVDWAHTREGVIVCDDGFRATTITSDVFRAAAVRLGLECYIREVDASSVFCTYCVPDSAPLRG